MKWLFFIIQTRYNQNGDNMQIVRKDGNTVPLLDNVFIVSQKAVKAAELIGSENVVNATIGSLYTEDEIIAAYDVVYDTYDHISKETKAQYAEAITGSAEFKRTVFDWVKGDNKFNLYHNVVATPGGTGAVALAMMNILDINMKVLLPSLAWSSYQLMAKNNHLQIALYDMFEGDHFNLDAFAQQADTIMHQQGKLLVIINDPLHNPSGYTMSDEEWQAVIRIINRLAKLGPCVLLNDIAYIDYAKKLSTARDYMCHFNEIDDNVAIIVAFSCSKTLTSYGMRLGAAIILAKNETTVKLIYDTFENSARAIWSNANNGWMANFVEVVNHNREAFLKEKQKYVDLLALRSEIFITEAKAVELPIYPYKEGFFVTLNITKPQLLERYHEALMNDHIYTVKLHNGIRVALCSVNLTKTKGLASRMKKIYDETIKNIA